MSKEKEEKPEEQKIENKHNEAKQVEVPTQYVNVFQIGEEIVDERELMVRIYNKLVNIEKQFT